MISTSTSWLNYAAILIFACSCFAQNEPPRAHSLEDVIVIRKYAEFNLGNLHRLTGQWRTEELTLVSEMSDGLAVVFMAEKGPFKKTKAGVKYGYVDAAGQVVIPFEFDYACPFDEHLAIVEVDQKAGVINPRGEWVVKPGEYKLRWTAYSNGRMAFEQDGRTGFLDAKGKVVIEPTILGTPLSGFEDGLCLIELHERSRRHLYIRRDGTVAFELPLHVCGSSFSEGIARIDCPTPDLHRACAFIDRNGRLITAPIYLGAGNFSEGLAPVTETDEGWQYINQRLSDARMIVRENGEEVDKTTYGKWGYINGDGKMVIPEKFDAAGRFFDGLARVKVGPKWGFINTQGEFVIKPRFEGVDDFSNGCARFYESKQVDGKTVQRFGIIGTKGNVIVPPTLDVEPDDW